MILLLASYIRYIKTINILYHFVNIGCIQLFMYFYECFVKADLNDKIFSDTYNYKIFKHNLDNNIITVKII